MIQFTKLSLKNPAALLIITLLIMTAGLVAFTTLKVENEPQVKLGFITIATFYPNSSPDDVFREITQPLEQAIANVNGIKTFISNSLESQSILTLSLQAEADREEVLAEVEKNISRTKLPPTATAPQAELRFIGNEPMYFIAISNRENLRSEVAFNELIKDTFLYEFNKIKGVDQVRSIGTFTPYIRIQPKIDRLHTMGLSVAELKQLLTANHLSSSLGSVTVNGEDQIVRLDNEYTSLEEIRQTKLSLPSTTGLAYLSLGDIADIDWQTEQFSISRLNQQQAVSLEITKAADANLVETGHLLQQQLSKYQEMYPDLDFFFVSDRLDYIQDSMGGMAREGLIGMIMAALVILLMLRNLRSTLIAIVSIPLSLLISFLFMAWFGITLNVMSLFGMAVAVGRVVDDSIVVIENMYRHFQLQQKRDEQTILFSVKEVAVAITSSTFTTVAVFVPIAFVSGLLGDFFKPFAVAVVCSLLASLLVAVTVVPVLANILMKKCQVKSKSRTKLYDRYQQWLSWSLGHKGKITLCVLLLFLSSIGLATRLPTGFLPELNMNIIYVDVKMPAGTSLTMMDQLANRIEEVIGPEEGISYLQTKIGSAEQEVKKPHILAMTLSLQPEVDVDHLLQVLQEKIEPMIPVDGQLTLRKPVAGAGGNFQVVLHGANFPELMETGEIIKQKLQENPLLYNIKDNLSEEKGQITLRVDREQATQWGFTPEQIAREVRMLLGSTELNTIKLAGKDIDLTLGLPEEELDSIEKLKLLWLKNARGQLFQLGDLAELKKEQVATQILRKDEQQYIQITADILGIDKGGVATEQTRLLKELPLPAGITLATEGIQQDMSKGLMEMGYAIDAAVFLVFLIMVITFGNFRAPLAILTSVPLATIGGFIGLFLANGVLDMTSLIGFLMLIGIVVTNAIVLIDRVHQQLALGLPIREALIEAGTTRLRPIMMTALATIAALLPLAFGVSGGSLLSKGLSVVVIGGLLSSTLLTLIIVPMVYEFLFTFTKRLRKKQSIQVVQEVE